MNSITESVLVESQSARNASISNISNDRALETLCKAKALVMALWQGTGVATNAQLAEFYEISEEVVRDNIRRNKEEFEADGLKLLKGKALKDVCEIISQSQNRTPSLTVWTPRAALRLGMLIRDSKIAQKVRSLILDVVEIANPAKTVPTVEGINNVVDIIFRGTDVHINIQTAIKLNAIEKNHPEYWQVCADARKQLSKIWVKTLCF